MTSPEWTAFPVVSAPVPGEVHVWRVPLDQPEARTTALLATLPGHEADRAARFYFDIDRRRFIVAHAALRGLLGAYLGTGPYHAPFELGTEGKPRLGSGTMLRFNLAHSAGVALVAVSTTGEVGVDLEGIDLTVPVDQIAERFFSPPECAALRALPMARRHEGFFHLWAQKEAYLKGRGDGVVTGLDHFDVEADPDRMPRLLADRRDPDALGRWHLSALPNESGFRMALATEGPAELRCFQWS